jgi:hypothetical protein
MEGYTKTKLLQIRDAPMTLRLQPRYSGGFYGASGERRTRTPIPQST